MRGGVALAALAAMTIAAGAEAAPSYEGNFTASECAYGGGFGYCDTQISDIASGFGGMFSRGWGPFAVRAPASPVIAFKPAPAPLRVADTAASPGAPAAPATVSAALPKAGTDDSTNSGLVLQAVIPSPPTVSVISVPEPAALALFGGALALLGLMRMQTPSTVRFRA